MFLCVWSHIYQRNLKSRICTQKRIPKEWKTDIDRKFKTVWRYLLSMPSINATKTTLNLTLWIKCYQRSCLYKKLETFNNWSKGFERSIKIFYIRHWWYHNHLKSYIYIFSLIQSSYTLKTNTGDYIFNLVIKYIKTVSTTFPAKTKSKNNTCN